mmetsp:Transcript_26858/g.77380  ORF Transcript_26858/g.77380 Transcript_26858/m.77380 type:complete len:206 (+) Transcript_26858:290-907(+)
MCVASLDEDRAPVRARRLGVQAVAVDLQLPRLVVEDPALVGTFGRASSKSAKGRCIQTPSTRLSASYLACSAVVHPVLRTSSGAAGQHTDLAACVQAESVLVPDRLAPHGMQVAILVDPPLLGRVGGIAGGVDDPCHQVLFDWALLQAPLLIDIWFEVLNLACDGVIFPQLVPLDGAVVPARPDVDTVAALVEAPAGGRLERLPI